MQTNNLPGAGCQALSEPGFTRQTLSTQEKCWHYQHVIRRWNHHLDGSQFKLVTDIADRTVGWSREWCVVQTNELAHACGLSVRQTQRVISTLVRRKVVVRERKHGWSKYQYRVNFKWRPEPMALGTKHQLGQGQHTGLAKKYQATPRVTSTSPQGDTSDTLKSNLKTVPPRLNQYHKPDDTVRAAMAVGYRTRMEPGTIRKTWDVAWQEAHGHQPPAWSKKEAGQVRHLIKWWGDKEGERFHAWLADVVIHWKSLVRGGKNPPPPMAHLGFILAARSMLLNRWHDREVGYFLQLQRSAEALQHNAGLTYEEALTELGKQEGFREAYAKLKGMAREVSAQVSYLERLKREHPELAIKAGKQGPIAQVKQTKDHWGATEYQ